MADDASKTEAPAPAAMPARFRFPLSSRILSVFFLLATLFTLGLWGSWHLRVGLSPEQKADDNLGNSPKRQTDDPTEIIARADHALRQLRYAEALTHLGEVREPGFLDTPLMSYRLALCQETNGLVDKAIASYRRTLGKSAAPSLTLACHLGLARCLLRQNEAGDARRLLYPFLLDEARQRGVSEDLVTEAYFLVALALARDNAAPATRPGQDAAVSSGFAPPETLLYLDEVAAHSAPRPAVEATPELHIQPETDDERTLVLSVRQINQPAAALLDRLVGESGMKPHWTAEAQKVVADRTLDLHLHHWELVDVLEYVADELDLTCLIDGPNVRFSTRAQTDAKRHRGARNDMAQRALQAALRIEGLHPHASATLLELGNLEAAQEHWFEASYWYHRLIRETRTSPHVTSAYYNLARTRRQNQDPDQARKAFFRVIDHAPGHELALRASIQIGLLYLLEDDLRKAIVQLQRAELMSVRSPHQPIATLALAAAQLQSGDPQAARKTLGRARSLIELEPYRPTAAFLDSYAQYRQAKATKDAKSGAGDLIETLWRSKDDTILGTYGHFLIAQAYHDLGFWDQAEVSARRALAEAPAPFKACVEYTLALTLLHKHQRTEAALMLARWTERENPYRARARYQLARLDLEDKRFRECIDACQSLWKERSLGDDTALLTLWGAALEGAGELTKAAQCYAGKAPE